MRSFDDLLHEAETADVTGWGFGWLAGRAVEERPPWSYVQLLARRFESGRAALDLDTGGGEVIDEMRVLPPRLVVTESWPPNARAARERLKPRGVQVVETAGTGRLPFGDGTFDLVTSRHPVAPNWSEIARVLHPGGHYFAQHVGPASAFELIEYFLGPLPDERRQRDPQDEADAAAQAGLVVTDLREARCRMEFYDVGAVVWILRKCPWWVPGFSVERYREQLVELDRRMRDGTPFVAHSTRHLIEARR
ncbi:MULTISPECIES: class I SAM-dependent methyltransferase [unclassified Mycobacterium]|uniref:class I SAM-dependent methyltransferase n=1 Tax=unclassified Mycobacterium TaxID=2642494 RepID=UPI00048F78BD|nr:MULTISPECIES: class I SAM-dependent methyltransferase [unclassified Mycobacterium]SEB10967.1 Methyltransferase domain-containing protein [Mycobacterium sp. 283mftsu]